MIELILFDTMLEFLSCQTIASMQEKTRDRTSAVVDTTFVDIYVDTEYPDMSI